MDRVTRMAIIIFCVVVILIMTLAALGFFSGRWDTL